MSWSVFGYRALFTLIAIAAVRACGAERVIAFPPAPSGIRSMFEAADGMLYLGCDDGVYRFDGLRYSRLDVFAGGAAKDSFIQQTDDGAIWIGKRDEGLVRIDPVSGAIRTVMTESVISLVAVGNTVYARRDDRSGVAIESTQFDLHHEFPRSNFPLFRDPTRRGSVWLSDRNEAQRFDPASGTFTRVTGLPARFRTAMPDGSGRVWILTEDRLEAWRDGRRVETHPTVLNPTNSRFMAGRDGQLWFQNDKELFGLNPPVTLPRFSFSPEVVHEGKHGRAWIGASGSRTLTLVAAGLAQWRTQHFDGASPVQLFRRGDGALILVTEKLLYRLDERVRRWIPLAPEPRAYQYVLPLPDGRMLASASYEGVIWLDANGKRLGQVEGTGDRDLYRGFRKLFPLPGARTAFGSKQGYTELRDGAGRIEAVPLPGVANEANRDESDPPSYNAVDFETAPDGKVWVGYEKGLASWDPQRNAWQRLSTSPEIEKVRSIAPGVGNEFWVALRSADHFARIRDGKVTTFAPAGGYSPGETYFLKRDRRGWIWRGTSLGVFVSDGKAVGPLDWVFLDAGGESRIYGYYEDRDGTVWIAGVDGVAHLKPDAAWFQKRAGKPEDPVLLADSEQVGKGDRRIVRPPRRLQIFFGDPRSQHPAPHWSTAVQYRLTPRHEDWRWTYDLAAEYDDLTAGSYTLEFRRGGYTDQWRDVLEVGTVGEASAWNGGVLMALPLAGLGVWAFVRREHLHYRVGQMVFLLRRRWQQMGESAAATPPDLSGRTLKNRYQLKRLMATGGFSQVYEAADAGLDGAPVAVKIWSQKASEADWVRKQFTHEAAALQLVDHPGVVRLLDSGVLVSGEPFLVMTLLDGTPLREVIATNDTWPAPGAAVIIERLGQTVHAIHAAGVIHRDVKPENILIQRGNRPVLVDFGSSGILGRSENAGVTRHLAGSIDYLAPERLTGHYSTAADIYALGAIAFELLAGKKLSESKVSIHGPGIARDLMDQLPPQMEADAGALLAEALNITPERRPGDAEQWARALAEAIRRSQRSLSAIH